MTLCTDTSVVAHTRHKTHSLPHHHHQSHTSPHHPHHILKRNHNYHLTSTFDYTFENHKHGRLGDFHQDWFSRARWPRCSSRDRHSWQERTECCSAQWWRRFDREEVRFDQRGKSTWAVEPRLTPVTSLCLGPSACPKSREALAFASVPCSLTLFIARRCRGTAPDQGRPLRRHCQAQDGGRQGW